MPDDENNITRISAEEIERRIAAGESKTDWDRVAAKTDADIEADMRDDPDLKDDFHDDPFKRRDADLEAQRPSVVFRPNLFPDGNAWLAVYGDLPSGVVGTGDTPAAAMADFDKAWLKKAVAPPGYGFAARLVKANFITNINEQPENESATAANAISDFSDLEDMIAAKDAAYAERNKLVRLLASLFHSGIKKTEIEGWDEEWHWCVYIDLPAGQVSWHFHDSELPMFADLPPYKGEWDGHDTDEKYRRVAAEAAVKHRAFIAWDLGTEVNVPPERLEEASDPNAIVAHAGDALPLCVSEEWFKRRYAWEGDLEIGAGLFVRNLTLFQSLSDMSLTMPQFSSIARQKLAALLRDGWEVNGLALCKDQQHRGFIDHGGFVGWWLPEYYVQHTSGSPLNIGGMLGLLVRLHQEGALSEGQIAKAAGIGRVEWRAIEDAILSGVRNTNSVASQNEPCLQANVQPVAYRWRGIGEWFYGPRAPEGVDAEPLFTAPEHMKRTSNRLTKEEG